MVQKSSPVNTYVADICTIGERLRSERERMGVTQPEFAKIAGAAKRTLIEWEKGATSPNAVQLSALNEAGVDVLYVLTGQKSAPAAMEPTATYAVTLKEDVFLPESVDMSGLVMVPRYDIQASAGGGALIHSEQIVDHLAFRQEWVAQKGLSRKALALIEVHGDSMEPSLFNNDLILIDLRVNSFSFNGVYAIQHRGLLLVKRIQIKLDGSVVIKSDNPVYEPELVAPSEVNEITVVGQVVWFGREM